MGLGCQPAEPVEKDKPMQTIAFHTGRKMPQLGFGLWQVDDAARVAATALQAGYRLVDGAAIYGNEAGQGQGIRDSGVPRDQIFVTTKVWNDRQGYDQTQRAVDESLARLGMDRVDLILIHWPCAGQNLYVDTWRALIALQQQGRVADIGVSNFNAAQIDRLIAETGVAPVLNQVELHPRFPQKALRAAHAARGIITQSWTPLGGGRSFDAPAIVAMATRLGKTPAQVILRWHIEIGCAVIPRSTRAAGLAENLAVWDFALSPDDHAAIAALDAGDRIGPDPDHFS
jgi:2,5-diketo-D-gluconate reductase A